MASPPSPPPAIALPIDDALPALAQALARGRNAVLVAPPGAGKTTRVPLALLDAPWVAGRKLIVLEPRRIAARGAAQRMAEMLGESVGETVGLRVRLGSKVGPRTRIEIVTEGVFNRMILDDPTLEGIAGILFDEFHERSLDADLGLALALDAQGAFRDDLRLLVMSATLDGARVASLLRTGDSDAAVIESAGRAFPVETRHVARDPALRLEDQIVAVILEAMAQDQGSVLVFLPGQGEIRRVEERLLARLGSGLGDSQTLICPLYGAMEPAAQDRAIRPAAAGQRKIVLATSIAETSLTIEGVRIVIDSGLSRVPVYEPDLGLTRLETVRVAQAAADQRRGRAGRTQPGICYRLWLEAATGSLSAFTAPEILSADLTSLMLDCASWGVTDPRTLRFLDPPPIPAMTEARTLLRDIGAIDGDGRITRQGRTLRALALPTRLARMVVAAAEYGQALEAAELGALLVERGLGGDATDLGTRLDRFRRESRGSESRNVGEGRAGQMRRLAGDWARVANQAAGAKPEAAPRNEETLSPGRILALAYPERVARARGQGATSGGAGGQPTMRYLLANGRGATLDAASPLAREPFIVVAEMTGSAGASRILSAIAIIEADVHLLAEAALAEAEGGNEAAIETVFDAGSGALRSRALRRYRALVLSERPMPVPATDESARLLAQGAAKGGIDRLGWSAAQRQLRARVAFLRAAERTEDVDIWPDLSEAGLARNVDIWLAPHLLGVTSLAAIDAARLGEALTELLPWDLKRRLDTEAPTHFEAPTGSRVAVDYGEAGDGQNMPEPRIAIRVQELFGLSTHPALASGKVPLVLELLSPGHRPIQITRDLPGFWRGSWASVKSEMKGRYPRHPWPDDPTSAMPTTRAKPRGT
jgi:ATP-dependent helicase HrpB